MLNPYSIIKRPYITEKTDKYRKNLNKYTFEVDINANKFEIVEAVKQLFNVKVTSINIIKLHGKKRSMRFKTPGKRPDRKKAIVTIAKGQNINIYEIAE
ncbi:MAG: 50S ribosomal protein L23 [Candidatus Firestonebacteria bacterium]|nr:50S ribosomal protein L23 [Candidatus Firestonebacteria bacterium]